MVEPEESPGGGVSTHPFRFGKISNLISTKVGRLCPPYYYFLLSPSRFLDLLPFCNTELQKEPWLYLWIYLKSHVVMHNTLGIMY